MDNEEQPSHEETLRKALRRAFSLGQTYWQQADSEYTSQHRKADETQAKFNELVESTLAHLQQRPLTGREGTAIPPDYRAEWPEFVRKLYIAARCDSSLGSVPSHVLEAARDILLDPSLPVREEPTGWKLVPVEPTPEMCAAAAEQGSYDTRRGSVTVASNIYRAMLATSPSPDKEGAAAKDGVGGTDGR